MEWITNCLTAIFLWLGDQPWVFVAIAFFLLGYLAGRNTPLESYVEQTRNELDPGLPPIEYERSLLWGVLASLLVLGVFYLMASGYSSPVVRGVARTGVLVFVLGLLIGIVIVCEQEWRKVFETRRRYVELSRPGVKSFVGTLETVDLNTGKIKVIDRTHATPVEATFYLTPKQAREIESHRNENIRVYHREEKAFAVFFPDEVVIYPKKRRFAWPKRQQTPKPIG